MGKLIRSAIAVGVLGLVVAPATSQAATITADTGGDGGAGCTLRAAVNSADQDNNQGGRCATAGSGNDIVQVPTSVGPVISLSTTELDAGDPSGTLEIQGPGAGALNVKGGAGFRVFRIMGVVTISDLTVSNGNPTGPIAQGGGIFVNSTGNLTLDRVAVSGNTAAATDANANPGAFGGGIHADGLLTIRDSTVSTNTASATLTAGGALNNANGFGGGVSVSGNDVTIDRSLIAGNIAIGTAPVGTAGSVARGGGLWTSTSGTNNALVRRSTITGNQVSGSLQTSGGGIEMTAGSGGTGVSTLESNTVTDNSGSSSANLSGDEVIVQNMLVSNPQGGGANCATWTDISSGGFNLEEATSTCGFNQPTDQTSVPSAGLDPNLLGNGGPTLTHALLPTSPAIDTGKSFAELTDQRGFIRPVDFPGLANAAGGDGADIGAVEVQQACAGQSTPSTTCPTATQPIIPLTPTTTAPTGQRAAALKKCKKKKDPAKRRKCKKRANRLPV